MHYLGNAGPGVRFCSSTILPLVKSGLAVEQYCSWTSVYVMMIIFLLGHILVLLFQHACRVGWHFTADIECYIRRGMQCIHE